MAQIQYTTLTNPIIRVDSSFESTISANVTISTATAATVTLLSENETRRMAMIYNNSDKTMYVKFGPSATTADCSVVISSLGYFEIPIPPYRGLVTGIWAAGPTGSALVTEY